MSFFRLIISAVLLSSAVNLCAAQQQSFGQSVSYFSTDFFKKVATKIKGDVITSPFSAQTVLSLLMQGAAGQTATEMASGLKFGNTAPIDVAANYRTLLTSLQANQMLKIANKIYIQRGYSVRSSFAEIATSFYYSAAETINFAASQTAADTINEWVASQTNDLIQNLIAPSALDALTRMVLINAIYFKGTWAKPFQTRQTIDATFYSNRKTSKPVKMMKMTTRYNYIEDANLNAKIIELPYKSSSLSMFVFLPNDIEGVSQLQEKLETYDLTQVTNGMTSQNVQLSLPKFKSTSSLTLNEYLRQMGLARIFSDAADFSGLISTMESLKVSTVVQKAFIEVNELGTEAAAATGVVVTSKSAVFNPPPPKVFNADHPFVYTIQERQGPAYFVGRYSNSS